MLSDTDEETSNRPIAVRSGRRSGRASATILRKDAEVEDVLPALDERDAGRRREKMERCIGGGGEGEEVVGDIGEDGKEFGGGARGVELATKVRRWVKRNGGHGGYRRLVEGCAKVGRTDRAPPRPRAVEKCVGVATRRRRCKENIASRSTRVVVCKPKACVQVAREYHVTMDRSLIPGRRSCTDTTWADIIH
jgi:hypothetical protein